MTSARGSKMAETRLDAAAALAAPDNASFNGVAPPRPKEPTKYTKTAAAKEPTMAVSMVGSGRERPKNAIPETTASDAPDRTPQLPGGAKRVRDSSRKG